MPIFARCPDNPLISPSDVKPSRPDFEVLGSFNAGATVHKGETILLLRVSERPSDQQASIIRCPHVDENGELVITDVKADDPNWETTDPRKIWNLATGGLLLTSISHIRLAHSRDGINFTVDEKPWLMPETEYERFGVEDPRITLLDGRYYANYTAVGPLGIATALVSTADFVDIARHGIIYSPANRDVVIFPERIGGLYHCYHRPMPWGFGGMNIWAASSPDLLRWGDHRLVLAGQDKGWRSGRIGGGAPPIRTDRGWLSFYHGADATNRYCMGAFLASVDDPCTIIAQSGGPVLEPEERYETEGFFGNVVFSCGVTVVPGMTPASDTEMVRLYYGAADQRIAMAEAPVGAVLEAMD